MATVVPPAANPEQAASNQTDVWQNPHEKVRRPSEWFVVAMVVFVFLGMELMFRVGGDRLSKDIAHLRSFPDIASEVAAMNPEDGTRVLFLGNSLTRYGVDPQLYAEVCGNLFDSQVQAAKLNPDNTALADWFYAYRTHFSRADIHPDVVVVGFEGGHLRDAPSSHPARLAQYYTTYADWADLQRSEVNGFEDSASFLLSRYSAAYGNRDRIQRRVLDSVIPDYREGMDELNASLVAQTKEQIVEETGPGYQRLLEFIAQAEQDGVQVILAAMPVPQAYEFDAGLLEVVDSTSAVLVDCRNVPGMTEDMFFDGLHMDERGQKLYSQTLAERSAPVLRQVADRHEAGRADVAGH
ncbi:hypothetical protein [Rubinisphaera brasiliensis]|uniref:Uncharacterized protein n=1 Tax=Rubinisphaera brasiliensis (strain ATCC 49424 / DSM 5305 / JCM 21570 / IAM 15109 / NBRC 103401 / IFAM 1448) TaxID=756272 RepID=F0SID7_RUBBR|nr:hypothetical protein [Rubinisphaera brasiliensis]ADY58526.1 hypothetical protein Plabr_0903 [Rubinisphaera brasiliensis DSM 5305]